MSNPQPPFDAREIPGLIARLREIIDGREVIPSATLRDGVARALELLQWQANRIAKLELAVEAFVCAGSQYLPSAGEPPVNTSDLTSATWSAAFTRASNDTDIQKIIREFQDRIKGGGRAP